MPLAMQGTVIELIIGTDNQLAQPPVEEDVSIETGVGLVDGCFGKVLRTALFLGSESIEDDPQQRQHCQQGDHDEQCRTVTCLLL